MGDAFQGKNIKEWEAFLNKIFNGRIPENHFWTEKKEIIKTLYWLGSNPEIHCTFLPDGGRLHLKRGDDSAEPDCLELHFVENPTCIVKPRILIFQSFDRAYEWAYFRLETKELRPSGWYENLAEMKEELTEISAGDYVDRRYWDLGYYEYDETGREQPLSSRARIVIRYFSGSFVIFAKGSPYNEMSSSFNGSHSKMTAEEFKEAIGGAVKSFRKEGKIQQAEKEAI
jgi:hypothetical protein